MKCSACANNECEGKFEYRDRCKGAKEGIDCSCYCKITGEDVFITSIFSIGAGVAAVAAGIGLTMSTGGLAAVVAGFAVAGGGTSLITSPIQKIVTNECVTFEDSVKDAALGVVIGAVTGPIGALGAVTSKGATVAVQVGARMAAGSAAGAASGVISEGAKLVKGEEVSLESLGKSIAIGVVAGSVGGASACLANSSVLKPVADAIGKPATRVITQASASMAADAGVQLTTTGEIDHKRLIANTTGQLVCGTAAEVASSMSLPNEQTNQQRTEPNDNGRPDQPDNQPGNSPGSYDKFGKANLNPDAGPLSHLEYGIDYEIISSESGSIKVILYPSGQEKNFYLSSQSVKNNVDTSFSNIESQNYVRYDTLMKNLNENHKEESTDLPKSLQCLVDLFNNSNSVNKRTINRRSIARALEILKNTNDPELYANLLQYNIPLDSVGIEATRLMLEQIFEVNINIEVEFDDSKYIFGDTARKNAKTIRLDLVDGHFINQLQDGESAYYNDCFYYAIAEQFSDILIMTPADMRRNISNVIKSNERMRNIIMHKCHTFYIDIGLYGGRQAERESDEEKLDEQKEVLENFWKNILELLRNPMGRNHSYESIDQDFPKRFGDKYKFPFEIDHVLPVNVWVNLFKYLQKLKKLGHPHERLLNLFQKLTGLKNPTNLTDTELQALVKKKFPCIILPGLVHRNLQTTGFSIDTMAYCGILRDAVERNILHVALHMIFEDHHNTTVNIRNTFRYIMYPLTLKEELDILHEWQRSIVAYYRQLKIISQEQANYILKEIAKFTLKPSFKTFPFSPKSLLIFSNIYKKMYGKSGLLPDDDKKDDSNDKKKK
ncbi:uncharacterized protein [Chironomus tepperi]|uniref:uncharacterized protein n=1 Tax=Chironomus tepperi TaxID=113505 RepID=UPI00391FAE7D